MIFFFYGPNTYMARQQISKVAGEYIKKTGSNMGIERIEGPKVKPEELRGALQAAPFLTSSRLVIIEDLGQNKSVAPKITDHIKDVPSTTVAIFYDPSVDQRTTYFKALSEKARTIKFEPMPVNKLHSWVAAKAKEEGAEIERPAIARLVERTGDDQWRLGNEISKLATYASPITVEAVNDMVEESHSETVFNLVEAMTGGQVERATRYYRQLRSDGQNEMYLLSMVIWQLRNLLFAKAAGKITPPQLAKAAGMSPYVAGKMLTKRHLFSEEQLKTAFIEAVDTDYQIKSGAGAGDVMVEQLIYRVSKRVAA